MSSAEIPSDIATTTAPLLLGDFFHWGLFGILTVQVYIYYLAFPNDRTAFKCVVYGLYLVETAQTLIVTHDAFFSYAKGFGNLAALDNIQTGWFAVPVLAGIVSCTVQLCYTYRIYILSRSKVLVVGISALALLQGGSAIAEGVREFKGGKFSRIGSTKLGSSSVAIGHIWLAGSAVCDVVIAASMTFLLKRHDTGMNATHVLVTRLVRLIIETGCLTATMAVIELILILVFPKKNYHVCIAVILAKLYTNSLLMVSNSRLRLANGRGSRMEASTSFIACENMTSSAAPHAIELGIPRSRTDASTLGGVKIEEETWSDNVKSNSRTSENKNKDTILPLGP